MLVISGATKEDEESDLKRRFMQNKSEKDNNVTKSEIIPSQRSETSGSVDTRRIGIISDRSWNGVIHSWNTNFRSANHTSANYVPRRVIRRRLILTFLVLVLLGLFRVWCGYLEFEWGKTIVEWLICSLFLYLILNCFRYVFHEHCMF